MGMPVDYILFHTKEVQHTNNKCVYIYIMHLYAYLQSYMYLHSYIDYIDL